MNSEFETEKSYSYFKTTLYGLSGCAPDYVMLMVGGNAGLIGMSKEHLGVALALNVPIAVCVTKVSHVLIRNGAK